MNTYTHIYKIIMHEVSSITLWLQDILKKTKLELGPLDNREHYEIAKILLSLKKTNNK